MAICVLLKILTLSVALLTASCQIQNVLSLNGHCWNDRRLQNYLTPLNGLVVHEFSYGSVDKAPTRCPECHTFDSRQGIRFFFAPCSCYVNHFIFLHNMVILATCSRNLMRFVLPKTEQN